MARKNILSVKLMILCRIQGTVWESVIHKLSNQFSLFIFTALLSLQEQSVLIIIGLGIFYWVDKYNLLRKSSVLENVNGELSMKAIKLIDFTLVLRPTGKLIFDSQIRSAITWESIVCLILGVIYLLLHMDRILDFFH